MEASIVPILDSEGTITGYVAVARDVTAQLHLERQLRQAQKMEAIGTLAGGIAHDFNNILSAILGFSELAREDAQENLELSAHLGQIIQAANRARDLVGQILSFSRLHEQDKRPVMLQPILREACRLLRASLPSTIELISELDENCGPVEADSTNIHQIIMNLGTNAYHAMRQHGGQFQVTLSPIELDATAAEQYLDLQPGPYAQLIVRDTGCGMDEKTRERIFDPYFTTRKKGEGTGLGLSTVHNIIRSYKGAIHVWSRLGKGAVFEILLPLTTKPMEQEANEITCPVQTLGRESILFVDDEELILQIAQKALERYGYQVTPCSSPLLALETFRRTPDAFQLVITDLTMPKLTGVELSQKLLAIRPQLPIILCTGFSENITQARAQELGIARFLIKPIRTQRLAQIIREVLDQSSTRPPNEAAEAVGKQTSAT